VGQHSDLEDQSGLAASAPWEINVDDAMRRADAEWTAMYWMKRCNKMDQRDPRASKLELAISVWLIVAGRHNY
jgi:hypothetical protein